MQTFPQAKLYFINHCKYEKKLSSKTIKSYLTDLNQFFTFLQSKNYFPDIQKITKKEIRDYLEFISHLEPATVKRKVATLKVMFNFLEFEELIESNPIRKTKIKIKNSLKIPVSLNINEIKTIFQHAYNEIKIKKIGIRYFNSIRNIAVLELLFATGARVSEISNLLFEDIDLNSGEIVIKGKGRKERIAQICDENILNALIKYRELITENKNNGPFLRNRLNKRLSEQSIRNIIRKLSKLLITNKHITPHTFRHTFATLLLEKDVDIKYIQILLGHSSIVTTQRYTHVNKEKQKRILEEKHPRKDMSFKIF